MFEDAAAAIDAFLAQPKEVVGADAPIQWVDGYHAGEKVIYLPLEVDGEQHGARLMVVGFPRADFLKFRLGILFPASICRLDFTDETHVNSAAEVADGIPAIVVGPHYHSWALNRRFCRGPALPARLHNADEFHDGGVQFDATLRWFLANNNIGQLPPLHMIELPTRDLLL